MNYNGTCDERLNWEIRMRLVKQRLRLLLDSSGQSDNRTLAVPGFHSPGYRITRELAIHTPGDDLSGGVAIPAAGVPSANTVEK